MDKQSKILLIIVAVFILMRFHGALQTVSAQGKETRISKILDAESFAGVSETVLSRMLALSIDYHISVADSAALIVAAMSASGLLPVNAAAQEQMQQSLAMTAGVNPELVAEMQAAGMGWGQICQELGLNTALMGMAQNQHQIQHQIRNQERNMARSREHMEATSRQMQTHTASKHGMAAMSSGGKGFGGSQSTHQGVHHSAHDVAGASQGISGSSSHGGSMGSHGGDSSGSGIGSSGGHGGDSGGMGGTGGGSGGGMGGGHK